MATRTLYQSYLDEQGQRNFDLVEQARQGQAEQEAASVEEGRKIAQGRDFRRFARAKEGLTSRQRALAIMADPGLLDEFYPKFTRMGVRVPDSELFATRSFNKLNNVTNFERQAAQLKNRGYPDLASKYDRWADENRKTHLKLGKDAMLAKSQENLDDLMLLDNINDQNSLNVTMQIAQNVRPRLAEELMQITEGGERFGPSTMEYIRGRMIDLTQGQEEMNLNMLSQQDELTVESREQKDKREQDLATRMKAATATAREKLKSTQEQQQEVETFEAKEMIKDRYKEIGELRKDREAVEQAVNAIQETKDALAVLPEATVGPVLGSKPGLIAQYIAGQLGVGNYQRVEELKGQLSRVGFRMIMSLSNARVVDSEKEQENLRDAIGRIDTNPETIENLLTRYESMFKSQVNRYNKQAKALGIDPVAPRAREEALEGEFKEEDIDPNDPEFLEEARRRGLL